MYVVGTDVRRVCIDPALRQEILGRKSTKGESVRGKPQYAAHKVERFAAARGTARIGLRHRKGAVRFALALDQ